MRLLHTSDWHLGRRLCDVSLLEDQAHALEQLYLLLREERPDALVVAGDVYDRAVPPEDAVRLLGDFAARVTRGLGLPLLAISGNHDSAERLGFGAELLEASGLHLRTRFAQRAVPVPVGSGGEAGLVYCLPYTEPDSARLALEDATLRTHDAAVRAALAAAREDWQARGQRNAVLVAHLFAQGASESPDSERPLEVGGAAQVGVDALEDFPYVALGHLHAPQSVAGRAHVRYSGSLLKYAFSEAQQEKGVSLVEVVGGRAQVREVSLRPRRDVVRLEGSFEELLRHPRFAFAEGAYVEATYTDTGYLIDVARRLRERFPHLLLALPRHLALEAQAAGLPPEALRLEDTQALLADFWAYVSPEAPLSEEHRAAFQRLLDGLVKDGALERAA